LRVLGEVEEWQGHSPEQLKAMKDGLERLKQQGVEAIGWTGRGRAASGAPRRGDGTGGIVFRWVQDQNQGRARWMDRAMAEHSTNYTNTFIALSPDSPAAAATVPPRPGTVAAMQHERLSAAPYTLTSDDLLFGIFADRNGIAQADRPAARAAFFSKGQPCLRCLPLVRSYGWGLHHDETGRVALYGAGMADHAAMLARGDLKQVAGMRSKRT
jgi:hypothetical protein